MMNYTYMHRSLDIIYIEKFEKLKRCWKYDLSC